MVSRLLGRAVSHLSIGRYLRASSLAPCSRAQCGTCVPSGLVRDKPVSTAARHEGKVAPLSAARRRPLESETATRKLLEEENLPGYEHEQFYAVHIGDKINGNYHVISKLGYGANSTVWLCQDTRDEQYVVLKVYVRTPAGRTNRENTAYDHLAGMTTSHPGCLFVRQALDVFDIAQSNGDIHLCLVHAPLQSTLSAFQTSNGRTHAFPEALVKVFVASMLEALDFLHTEAKITHCDLKLSKIMLGTGDATLFADYAEAGATNPSEREVIDDERTIYASRRLRRLGADDIGLPVLCYFGEARIGSLHAFAKIQPEIYRAPEILMETEWGHSVDIWNLGYVMWDMLEAEHLFDSYSETGDHNNRYHMREIVNLIGLPPKEFLSKSKHSSRLIDAVENWKAEPPLAPLSLEARAKHMDSENRAQLLDFLQSMLRWLPEERKSAWELLQHDWLAGIELYQEA